MSPSAPRFAQGSIVVFTAAAAACSGPLSALDTAGRDADEIARLFWIMTIGAAIVWAAVTALALYAGTVDRKLVAPERGLALIVGGGVVVPVVVLAALLVYALPQLGRMADTPRDDRLKVMVTGEQWWWRVRYRTPAGEEVDLANELRLPVDQTVDVHLASDNVIHSFWIPSLAGKVDMIPGRLTHLSLEPQRTGVFRGACAEYCGTSHALMGFVVSVLEPDAFAQWLNNQRQPAREPSTPAGLQGRDVFNRSGCGACHVVRGTSAAGVGGPDLTHVADRLSLAAGVLPNDEPSLALWVNHPQRTKPGAHMPPFASLGEGDLASIAAYLGELR